MGVTTSLLVGLSLVLLLVAGCTAPTPTFSAYRNTAEQSITELISAAETGAMLGDVRLADGATSTYLGTTVESAEEAARSISKTFGTRQPPTSEADALREELVPLCDTVVNTLAELRIAVRQRPRVLLPGVVVRGVRGVHPPDDLHEGGAVRCPKKKGPCSGSVSRSWTARSWTVTG